MEECGGSTKVTDIKKIPSLHSVVIPLCGEDKEKKQFYTHLHIIILNTVKQGFIMGFENLRHF